ncbi:MAG: 2-oxoacid:acceptor oxidoreductase subunit alpha [Candidatus Heimdallarchaeota archaeon]|nr:2-oxoacid:acceptor oxidoreductase subunit alpha [Candidatus Heimdallarchaeota archaeon]
MAGKRVLTGKHFMKGDYAISEGAMAAGLNFFGAYPITPATPVAERVSVRSLDIPNLEFLQFEDEIASMAAIIGASCAGAKSMTSTSGPGVSLMLENIGLAYMMETPTVIVNIMRGGPSTGMPTRTSQGDIMQANWGSHGDYNMIAYVPTTIQEYFDFTIKSFNAAETYRTPVMLLGDQVTGLSTSNLVIPKEEDIELVYRKTLPNAWEVSQEVRDAFLTYDDTELIPPMAITGQGYNVHMTGLTHDTRGYPKATPDAQSRLMKRLDRKFTDNVDKIVEYEEYLMEDAEICVVCFGTEARAVKAGIHKARAKDIKVGMLRMKVVWPFHEKLFKDLGKKVSKVIVAEGNMGQYYHPVKENVPYPTQVYSYPDYGGAIHTPAQIYEKILEVKEL